MATAHSVSLSPKLLSQGQKIDFAPCANSGGLLLTACCTVLRKSQRLHPGSLGRNAELISGVC